MKRLFTVLLCAMVVAASFACSEDKGKATKQGQHKASTQAQKKQLASAKRHAKADPKRKAQDDRSAKCNTQANLKNLKGEDRRRFMSSCLGG